MTYDAKCLELAKLFLADEKMDTPKHRTALAIAIQRTVEDYIEYERDVEEMNLNANQGESQ